MQSEWEDYGAARRKNPYRSSVPSMEPETQLPTQMEAQYPGYVWRPMFNPMTGRFHMRQVDQLTANEMSKGVPELPLPSSSFPLKPGY